VQVIGNFPDDSVWLPLNSNGYLTSPVAPGSIFNEDRHWERVRIVLMAQIEPRIDPSNSMGYQEYRIASLWHRECRMPF
jgi:hypothetical protein